MTWVLVVSILATNQIFGLPEPSEAKCLADLQGYRTGVHNVVRLADGIVLPVQHAFGCVTREEFEARKGGGI